MKSIHPLFTIFSSGYWLDLKILTDQVKNAFTDHAQRFWSLAGEITINSSQHLLVGGII